MRNERKWVEEERVGTSSKGCKKKKKKEQVDACVLQGHVQTVVQMMFTVKPPLLLSPLPHILYGDGSLTRRCAETSGTHARTGSAPPRKSGSPQPGATAGPARQRQ